jgi:hypothetical protein
MHHSNLKSLTPSDSFAIVDLQTTFRRQSGGMFIIQLSAYLSLCLELE